MTKDGNDILRTLSREQVSRLQNLGATVTETAVTATEDQLWRSGLGSGLRSRLLRGDQLTIADTGGGGGGDEFTLQLGGLNLQLDGLNLTLEVPS